MEQFLSTFSRNLFVIPGGYFVSKLIRKLYPISTKGQSWRTFSFRGVNLKVDTAKQMGNSIYWRGAHDWAPIFTIEKYLKPGDTFVDVGANQGEYSLWAARKVGKNGKVLSFEPMQELFNQLEENIRINPNFHQTIFPIQLGLSDNPGEVKLFTSADANEGTNTIYTSENFKIEVGKIQLDTLDHQLELMGVEGKINMIKIDVEGAELPVLKGAQNTLQLHRPILLLEINKDACISGGYQPEDLLNLLKPLNYSFFKIGLRGSLKTVSELPDFCNILALPN